MERKVFLRGCESHLKVSQKKIDPVKQIKSIVKFGGNPFFLKSTSHRTRYYKDLAILSMLRKL